MQECQGLENEFGTTFTNCLLRNEGAASIREIKEELQESDRTKLLERCGAAHRGKSRMEESLGGSIDFKISLHQGIVVLE